MTVKAVMLKVRRLHAVAHAAVVRPNSLWHTGNRTALAFFAQTSSVSFWLHLLLNPRQRSTKQLMDFVHPEVVEDLYHGGNKEAVKHEILKATELCWGTFDPLADVGLQ